MREDYYTNTLEQAARWAELHADPPDPPDLPEPWELVEDAQRVPEECHWCGALVGPHEWDTSYDGWERCPYCQGG